jgi:hypothetical protein
MARKLLLCAATCALSLAALPSMALAAESNWTVSQYVNPDGSYSSYGDYSRDLDGVPCGIECSRNLAAERATENRATGYYTMRRRNW